MKHRISLQLPAGTAVAAEWPKRRSPHERISTPRFFIPNPRNLRGICTLIVGAVLASLSMPGCKHPGGMHPTAQLEHPTLAHEPADGADARSSGSSVRVLPENPRYFLWRGKPVALIGASEAGGAVFNLDSDHDLYLDTVAAGRGNLVQIMTGTMVEAAADRSLSPQPGRLLPPWARSTEPGYAGGGEKFDLQKFDPRFFARLRSFVDKANRRGIVVKVVLFNPPARGEAIQWTLSPLHPTNNINRIEVGSLDVYTLDRHAGLLPIQEALVRRMVEELSGFDGVIYEVCYRSNGRVGAGWEEHMTTVLIDEQKRTGDTSLVAWDLGSGSSRQIDRRVSVLDHTLANPSVVTQRPAEKRPIGNSAIGVEFLTEAIVRMKAWDFVFAGGGLYIQTDESIRPSDPLGVKRPRTYLSPGPAERRHLRTLIEFMGGLDLRRLAPAPELLASPPTPGLVVRTMAQGDAVYLLYARTPPPPRVATVRWTGRLVPRFSEAHTVTAQFRNGVRMWIDGRLVVDAWGNHGAASKAATVQLEAGVPVSLKIEHIAASGQGQVRLRWQSARQPSEIVPGAQLLTPEGEPGGLRAEYFAGNDFRDSRGTAKGAVDWQVTSSVFCPGPPAPKLHATLVVPNGRYRVEWVAPATGDIVTHSEASPAEGTLQIAAPPFTEDIVARIVRLPEKRANTADATPIAPARPPFLQAPSDPRAKGELCGLVGSAVVQNPRHQDYIRRHAFGGDLSRGEGSPPHVELLHLPAGSFLTLDCPCL
ncbi:MAG: PA14 domain-containing protein [Limisphaerales bacterium]